MLTRAQAYSSKRVTTSERPSATGVEPKLRGGVAVWLTKFRTPCLYMDIQISSGVPENTVVWFDTKHSIYSKCSRLFAKHIPKGNLANVVTLLVTLDSGALKARSTEEDPGSFRVGSHCLSCGTRVCPSYTPMDCQTTTIPAPPPPPSAIHYYYLLPLPHPLLQTITKEFSDHTKNLIASY
ncbi:hypothetical protein M0802_004818 [Mischocyttarus mexicanus]|nr:hypothetical protein M0802_004818 [Mischocyttarus mexicanus]